MITRAEIDAAIDGCGIEWAEATFAPRKAPEPPYATVRDELRYEGSDEHVGMVGHDTRILLYDKGDAAGRAMRESLARALAGLGAPFTRYPPDYSYELKLFETEFAFDETYYEKWSEQ